MHWRIAGGLLALGLVCAAPSCDRKRDPKHPEPVPIAPEPEQPLTPASRFIRPGEIDPGSIADGRAHATPSELELLRDEAPTQVGGSGGIPSYGGSGGTGATGGSGGTGGTGATGGSGGTGGTGASGGSGGTGGAP